MEEYKNVLITGGCGFIGSNFINDIFEDNDINIINIDKLNYCGNEDNIKKEIRENKRYILYKVCLQNMNVVYDILEKHNIDLIIHFAAQTHVTRSFVNTDDFIKDNIIGSFNLLEAVKKYGKIKSMINFSTDEVYGESYHEDKKGKTERDKLEPTNPYAASKASVEMIVKSYIYSYKLPIITIRCNNVYGYNQYKEKVIPKFIYLLKNNKKITIEGDGKNKRAFVHTNDVNRAILLILKHFKIGDIYNIGINNEITIYELAKKMIKYIKNADDFENYIEYVSDRNYNDKRYFIDYSKLKSIGWNPKKNFDEELKNIIKDF
jgi:dTDP-glucose 4,6-dehydratase